MVNFLSKLGRSLTVTGLIYRHCVCFAVFVFLIDVQHDYAFFFVIFAFSIFYILNDSAAVLVPINLYIHLYTPQMYSKNT